jgi:tetratricopeptide (TPR) repeat protein
MATSESPLDQLRKALRDLRSGALDPATVRHLQTGRAPAALADLAALFGAKVLPPPETAVRAQLNRECTLIEQSPFKPGEVIGGRYEVLRLHGGGFGLVYVCRQLGPEAYERSQNLVALKTPLPRHLAHAAMREMFLAEAAHCVALGPHPNLVLAYGVEEYNRLPFLVLEYIPNARSLADELAAGRADWRTAVRVGLGTARGLAFAGLVHGDLKPQNLLIGPDGAAKVADFGLSLTADEQAEEGVLIGTQGFYAPEMLAGRPERTAATDVYAFGVTFFVTATGEMPHPCGEARVSLQRPAPDPRTFNPDIPAAFAALLLRCLARDPARRPAGFAELAAELAVLHRTLLGVEPAADPAPDAPARADALVNAAQTWLNLGRPDKARAAARQALVQNPRNWKAHTALGSVHFQAGEHSAARASFTAAHEFDDEAVEPILGAANASHHLGQPDEARRWLGLAVKRCAARGQFAPLDSASLLIIELLAEKDAYNLVHRILSDNPRAAITWNNRAVLLRRMGAPPEDILASAERALALNPAYAKAHVQQANALLELRRWDEALEAADRALALDAALAGAYAAKFSALATLGRLAEARACVDRGLSVLPGHELLLRARAKLPR